MNKFIFLLFLPFLIEGCTTFSKSECENFDWYNIGYQSANQGDQISEKINYYQRECGLEHNVRVKIENFESGFNKGLEVFCSPIGGKNLGYSGKTYKGTCPKTLEDSFVKSYEPARLGYLESKVRELESTVSHLRSEVSSKESRINTLEAEVSSLSSRVCP